MSLLVGLTGGMGSGKTLASSFFHELGAHIIDADLICRKLVEPGQPALQEITDYFGKLIIDKSGNLNRNKLGQLVFCDSKKREKIENILHPKVFKVEKLNYKAICKINPKALVIVDAALLIESANYKEMDKVILINADEKIRIQRILSRGKWNQEEIVARLKSQMPNEEKIKYADFVLENSKDKTYLKEQVKNLYTKLCLLASENISKITP
ncbi:MAG: dephospho-CoA kinase [Nitrospinota bacterium]|nr:dephospho-CoA kinase [Nitrospinota bacterium]